MKRRFLIIAILALFALPTEMAAQSTAELERTVNEIRRSAGMQHGTLAVSVYNIRQQKTVYSYNAEQSMIPASIEKLLTTGTGFARLGSNFRFTTKVGMRGDVDRDGVLHGNIYITGGGDPTLGSYRYRQTSQDSLFDGWMRALKRKGVRRIDDRVCYNVTIYDEQPMHDTWQWGDIGNYYATGASALNFHENMFFVYFNAGAKIGYPATAVSVKPKSLEMHSVCEVTTAAETTGDNVTIYGSPYSKERLYRGTVPLGKQNFPVRGAMPDPARSCADMFSSYLRTHGVGVSSNSMQVYSQPDSLRSVVDQYSSEYYTIVQYTNLTSNNLYAESIFKYLGYKKYGIGSFENGSRAVMDYLKGLNLPTGGVRIVDGSGLSRSNALTADFLCRYLAALTKETFRDDFIASLPKAGETGTAKNLLPNLPAGISVRVKTGTMDGVKSYAGYITTARGEMLTFCIMSNGHECSSAEVAGKLNRLLYKIATLY